MRTLIIFLFLYTTPLLASHLIDTNVNMVGVWKGVYIDAGSPMSPYYFKVNLDTTDTSATDDDISVTQINANRWYFESLIRVYISKNFEKTTGLLMGVTRQDSILLFITRGPHFPGLFTFKGKRIKKLSDDRVSIPSHLYYGTAYRHKHDEELIFKESTFGFFFIYKED